MERNANCILVTGAAGFIGSHLTEQLLRNGYHVIGLDNFNDYYDTALKESNVKELLQHSFFHIVRGDVRDEGLLGRIFGERAIKTVVHLAALAGVRSSIEHPAEYMDVNAVGTAKVLDVAAKRGVENFVLASSSSVYGKRSKVPFNEDDQTSSPYSPYAASKKAAEVLAYAYHSLYDMPISCLRFFTVYGSRGRPDMAPFKFIDRIYRGVPIQRYGDGSSVRDYTHVSDIVQGTVKAIEKPHSYEIFNIGNANAVKLTDFIATIEECLGTDAIIEEMPLQPGDVPTTLADIRKAKSMLGYEPSVQLRDGISETVEWYKRTFG